MLSSIRQLVADDLKATDLLILDQLHSDVALINQIGHYIVNSGGKRLRPLLVLLAARAVGYQGQHHIQLAAIIEFIHTATLIHDDVVDESKIRRNKQTANSIWGNAVSVLVGDFLYSRSFEMMVELKQMKVMDVLSHATNRIAEGEVLQLLNCHDPEVDESRYRQVIERKTATLFEAGTRLAGIIADRPENEINALANYGYHLGIAFQMIDDALDYGSSQTDIGKNIGDDLAEGKPTLPLIRAMQTADEPSKQFLKQVIQQRDVNSIQSVIDILAQTDAIQYTLQKAKDEAELAQNALQYIPPSAYQTALHHLAEFTVERSF